MEIRDEMNYKERQIYEVNLTREVTQLVKYPDVMNEFRKQIKAHLKIIADTPLGKRILPDLTGDYWVIAIIHDDKGGHPKILADELRSKVPKNYKLEYRLEYSGIALENVKADLEQKGLWPHKQKNEKQELAKYESWEGSGKYVRPLFSSEICNDDEVKLPPSSKRAYQSINYAKEKEPMLKDATDGEIYNWLIDPENHDDENHPYYQENMPVFNTWSRYVRKVRRCCQMQKKQLRIGRPYGSSVVHINQIKYQSSQHPKPDKNRT